MAEEQRGRSAPRMHFPFEKSFRARASSESDRVVVELLTDPWSVWCWGFEPVRRCLQIRYPTIEFRNLLGGMFPRMPRRDEMPFDVDRFFGQVQRTSGMPVRADVVKEDPPESTFPACIHVHAARLVDPPKADAYLRAMREAVYLDGRNVSRKDVAADVAEKVGIDRTTFEAEVDAGRAESQFKARMKRLTRQNLEAYPTLLVRSGNRGTRIEGFHALPAVLGVVEAASGKIHPPLPDPPLTQIVRPGERVATREVAEVLGVSIERAVEVLGDAVDEAVLERTRYPAGDVWSLVDQEREVPDGSS